MITDLQPPIRGLVLDMDGVLWRGSQPLGNLPAIFLRLNDLKVKFVLATNNATSSIQQYLQRMDGYKVRLEPWQVINSGQTAAFLLHQIFPKGGPVYVVGEAGLVDSLAEFDFYPSDDGAMAVVAGLDRKFTYEKLRCASTLIRSGKLFIGTNPDLTFPAPEGITPGAGSILAAIQAASGVSPRIAGKPEPAMYQLAIQRLALPKEQVLAVGDRLDTDILGGQRAGIRTAVVLTGVTSLDEAEQWLPKPDLIEPSLSDLVGL